MVIELCRAIRASVNEPHTVAMRVRAVCLITYGSNATSGKGNGFSPVRARSALILMTSAFPAANKKLRHKSMRWGFYNRLYSVTLLGIGAKTSIRVCGVTSMHSRSPSCRSADIRVRRPPMTVNFRS